MFLSQIVAMDFTDCDFSGDLLGDDLLLFGDDDFLNAEPEADVEENLRVLASFAPANARKVANIREEYYHAEKERDAILYPELVAQRQAEEEIHYRPVKPFVDATPLTSRIGPNGTKRSKKVPRKLFNDDEVIPQSAYQSLDEALEEIAHGPIHSSTPVKKTRADFLSQSLPHYEELDSGFNDEFSAFNSTIPDESRYTSANPDLTIKPWVLEKMENIARIKVVKQQEVDQMYVDNSKISEEISAAHIDASNASQELERKVDEISKSSDLCESLNESISCRESKLSDLEQLNKSQKKIEDLPAHLQDYARQIEAKKAKLVQKDAQIQALEIEQLQIESQIAGDTYSQIVGVEGRKKDQKLSRLEAKLAELHEENTEHEENIKDMNKRQVSIYSKDNAKSNLISPEEVKEVEEMERLLAPNSEWWALRITIATAIRAKQGIGSASDPNEIKSLAKNFEKMTQKIKSIELIVKKQEEKNAKLMIELIETKKNFKSKFRDQKAMIRLAEAEKTKKMYVDSIRSLRTIIFNLRKQFNDTCIKAGPRNEALLKRGLKSMQRTLAVCEANNWQRSYNETLKAEEIMDPSCDIDTYKWVSARPAPVKSVMVPNRSNLGYLNEKDLKLTSLRKDLRNTLNL